jgi:hypothetical protein
MSRVYPERKWIKERMHHTEKRNINRLKKYPYEHGASPRESRIAADQAQKKRARNARSTRQTEDFPASNNVK